MTNDGQFPSSPFSEPGIGLIQMRHSDTRLYTADRPCQAKDSGSNKHQSTHNLFSLSASDASISFPRCTLVPPEFSFPAYVQSLDTHRYTSPDIVPSYSTCHPVLFTPLLPRRPCLPYLPDASPQSFHPPLSTPIPAPYVHRSPPSPSNPTR